MKRCPKCGGQTFRVRAAGIESDVYYDGDGKITKIEAWESDAPEIWEVQEIICEGTYNMRPDGSKTAPCDMEFKDWNEIPDAEGKCHE